MEGQSGMEAGGTDVGMEGHNEDWPGLSGVLQTPQRIMMMARYHVILSSARRPSTGITHNPVCLSPFVAF